MSAVELSAHVCNKTAVASNRKPKLERFYPLSKKENLFDNSAR
jgi:hypothetical protein